jgi:ribonuclease HI
MPAPRRKRPAIKESPVEPLEGEVLVWTDGACSGNPGPGGWAATAALEGLRSLPAGARACVVTDSQLMLNSMTQWLPGWKRKGWKTAAGQPVKNQDLLLALEAEVARHEAVRWHWVRGHQTGESHEHKALNDRADQLAVAAAAAAR